MKKRNIRDKFGNFTCLNLTHFAAVACYYSFIVAYMVKRGFSSSQIGLVMTLNSVVSITVQPLWGLLCDRLRSVRKVYVFLTFALAVLVPFITLLPNYAYFIFWLPCVITLFYCSANSLLDSWIVSGVKDLPGKSYGAIRMWGSLGFMAVVGLMGWLSDVFTIEIVFYSFSVFMLLDAAVAFSVRNEGVPETSEPGTKKPRLFDIPFGRLFKNYFYSILVLCAFLAQLPLALVNNFLVQRVYFAGGSDALYGLCHSVSSLCEVPVLLFSSKFIKRFHPQRTLKAAMFTYASLLFALSFPISAWGVLATQVIQGLGYSLFLVSVVSYVDILSPPGLKTSAMTLASAIYVGASGILGNLLAGFLIDSIGIERTFLYGGAFVFSAFGLYLILYKIGVKKRLSDGLQVP